MNLLSFRLPAVALGLALLGGCAATRLETQAQLPAPLVDRQPARIGIYYSKEFREYVHKETRGHVDYEVTLGPAHVTNLNWLLGAMFAEVVPVEDPTRVADVRPPLVLVLEPRFEEYSFLTPNDVAGDAFIVTIRYLLTVYDGNGGRVDTLTYTGYGRETARSLGSRVPLQIATQRAMRDAGAKVAVELPDQEAVRLLLRNPFPERQHAFPAVPPPADAPPGQPPAPAPEPGSPAETEPPPPAPSPASSPAP
ncbi:MAG TPA: hypothetical protein VH856_04440 [Steroidobacteraceae bacterium]|jgi:hypothetical protein